MTDGRDPRDDAVERAWREHAREAPPAALDDAIRAAAHRAVGSKPQAKPAVAEAREPWRWWMPLAAAATIGAVAIGVIQNLPHDAGEPTVVSDAATAGRSPAAESRASAGSTPAAVAPPGAQPAVAPTTAGRSDVARQSPAPASAARTTAPAAMEAQPPADARSTRLAEAPVTGKQRADAMHESKEMAAKPAAEQVGAQRAPDTEVAAVAKRAESDAKDARKAERESAAGFVASPPPAGAPPKLAAGAPAMSKADAPLPDATAMRARPAAPPAVAQGSAVKLPDAFVAEIRRLLGANDAEGAARELRAFRQAYADADARLPVEMRAWAADVAR